MSEYWQKIKGLFVEEVASSKSPAAAPETPSPPVAPEKAAAPTPAPQVAAEGNISDRFMQVLSEALEKNNQPGFDYLEFRQAIKNLSNMPMDEPTRFQSAGAMAQTMGVTPQALLSSAQQYLQVLQGEANKFQEAHTQQRAKLIGNREEEIKSIETMVEHKKQQIQNLQQQIEQDSAKSQQLRAEIESSMVKIESTKADFETTFAALAGQIQTDLEKIKTHLGG
ncbi:MAG: hypothetical protein J0L99_02555 [Chitinophagales bacterium]|nr:hypothetical protein [Chitinophagales bacterium]